MGALNRNEAPILVLGMHRSGTSATTGLIAGLGAYLGPSRLIQPPDENNPEGYFELQPAMALNDRILRLMQCTWHSPPPAASSEIPPLPDNYVAAIRRIVDSLHAEGAREARPWVLKDPRITVLWRYWIDAMPAARIVVCTRDPRGVVKSLAARDGFSLSYSLNLWAQYADHLLSIPRTRIAAHVNYEDLVARPDQTARELNRRLDLGAGEDSLCNAAGRVRTAAKRDRTIQDFPLPQEVLLRYEALRKLAPI